MDALAACTAAVLWVKSRGAATNVVVRHSVALAVSALGSEPLQAQRAPVQHGPQAPQLPGGLDLDIPIHRQADVQPQTSALSAPAPAPQQEPIKPSDAGTRRRSARVAAKAV